MKALY